jgi:nicotinamidase/pyrazinamidase
MQILVIVDPILDFFPGGSLGVPGADDIIPVINSYMESGDYSAVILIQEQHPQHHISFASTHGLAPFSPAIDIEVADGLTVKQEMWPDHCVALTYGGDVHPNLEMVYVTHTVKKGMNPLVDSYSGVKDAAGNHTGLAGLLDTIVYDPARVRQQGSQDTIEVVGLATDYCVKATAVDISDLGFKTRILLDGCRGVELAGGDTASAIRAMQAKGIQVI